MKETIIEILTSIKPNVDFASETGFVDKGILESFDVIRLVSLLADEFDVEFTAAELVPENFNSVDAIAHIVEELED